MAKRLFFLLALLLACSATRAQQQNFPGSGSGSTPGVFNFLNYGAIDDDTTDNCATGAVAAFTTAVNAYAGSAQAQAIIGPGFLNKAFKLATNSNACSFIFTKPVVLTISANIDCAQTANNCLQVGPTGLGALSNAQTPPYRVSGGGTFIDGSHLVNAGIEVESWISSAFISGMHFNNFGKTGTPTTGVCNNWAIQVDANVAEATIAYNQWDVTDNNNGRCGFSNANSAGGNTVWFIGNILAGQSLTNPTGCSTQGILDGGNLGMSRDNNIYAFAISIRVQGNGHRITGNQLDAAGCTASSVSANIQFGAAGSSTAVGPIAIIGNIGQVTSGANHENFMFARAGDSTATIFNVSLIGNQSNNPYNDGNLMPITQACSSGGGSTLCYEQGNVNMLNVVSSGATALGWQYGSILASNAVTGTAPTNISTTALFTPAVVNGITVGCQVLLTVAATTSSTLPQCQVTYTDTFTNTAQTIILTPVWASGTPGCSGVATNTVGNSCQGATGVIAPKLNTAVNFSTINAASSGGTAMQYQVFIRANAQ